MAGPGGTIFLGADDNHFPGVGDDNSGDEIIFAEGGNDTVLAGIGNDELHGGIGDDELFGEDGNDFIVGDDGADRIEGGDGNDNIWDFQGTHCFIDAGAGFDSIQIGSSFGILSVINGGSGEDSLQTTATLSLQLIAISGIETFETFGNAITATAGQFEGFRSIIASGENPDGDLGRLALPGIAGVPQLLNLASELQDRDVFFIGSLGDDTLTMGEGNDTINGLSGNDSLSGRGGNDVLVGGGGRDVLTGGEGRDALTGGGGLDRFVLAATGDSAAGAQRDTIRDFIAGSDTIDLRRIDALAGAGDDAFDFIGETAFSGSGGELRYEFSGGKTIISGDIDGLNGADFQIALTGNIVLAETDFLL